MPYGGLHGGYLPIVRPTAKGVSPTVHQTGNVHGNCIAGNDAEDKGNPKAFTPKKHRNSRWNDQKKEGQPENFVILSLKPDQRVGQYVGQVNGGALASQLRMFGKYCPALNGVR